MDLKVKHDPCSEFFFFSLPTIIKEKRVLKLRFLFAHWSDACGHLFLALVTSDRDFPLQAVFARYRHLTRALKQNYFSWGEKKKQPVCVASSLYTAALSQHKVADGSGLNALAKLQNNEIMRPPMQVWLHYGLSWIWNRASTKRS